MLDALFVVIFSPIIDLICLHLACKKVKITTHTRIMAGVIFANLSLLSATVLEIIRLSEVTGRGETGGMDC